MEMPRWHLKSICVPRDSAQRESEGLCLPTREHPQPVWILHSVKTELISAAKMGQMEVPNREAGGRGYRASCVTSDARVHTDLPSIGFNLRQKKKGEN